MSVPSFIYSKDLGHAYPRDTGSRVYDHVPVSITLYTVRTQSMELIGGSKLIARLDGDHVRYFNGPRGVRFPTEVAHRLQTLRDVLDNPEKLASFFTTTWWPVSFKLGMVAFHEEDAVRDAYQRGYRHRADYSKGQWKALGEYQGRLSDEEAQASLAAAIARARK
ncbi:MAG: hypothetical protein JWL82_559 [Parcubacteria group bacterium]|nr:hypothetical protein [Parcubacteria group bacterium]